MNTNLFPQYIKENYTLTGTFLYRSGRSASTYIDVRSALLENQVFFRNHLQSSFKGRKLDKDVVMVGTGVSGAIICTLISTILGHKVSIWNPKGHGVEWSPRLPEGTEVFMVDDLISSGGTLMDLRGACERAKLNVIGSWTVMGGFNDE